MEPKILQLPVVIASPTDLGRLIRELAMIDEQLLQLSLRKPGSEVKLPKTTQLMDQLISINKLNLLQPEDRQWLQQALEAVSQKAPVIHMSFSVDPSTAFLEKLMVWLRREIHPLMMITIGLQPNIGAGCVVRSTNRVFDFSLRQNFALKRAMLRQALSASPPAVPAPITAPAPASSPEAAA
jgi:F0F1-type ATP synthase delta subunit